MSQTTVPANAPQPSHHSADGEFLNYSDFIERQLGKTRGQVKSVELFSEALVLVVGSVSYLLAVVLLDHWLITGGLGVSSRLFACGVLAAGAGIFAWLRILPLLLREINPIYAADTIERSTPTLKNSLINFLLLRSTQAPMTKLVYDAIEQRAATDLSHVPVEGVVDRSRLIKIFYVLMALVAFGCVYKLASPKDPIRSMGRVIFPWTDLAAPTRVLIEEVKPGNAQAFLGSMVTVKALVSGLAEDEAATLYYSTEDGSVVDQAVPLEVREGMQHEARLPPDADGSTGGLGQSVRYYLTAGDFRTPDFRIEVVPPPTIAVELVEYDYPSYTGMPRRVVKNQGDLKALEGTRVVVHAASNQTIQSGTALLDLDSDGRPPTIPLRNEGDDGKHVWGAFELKLQKDGTPQHESYLLRYRNSDSTLNPSPIRHRIEVVADLAPTVEFTAPAKDVELPVNQTLELALRAADQDFALQQVLVRMQVRDKELYPATQPLGDPGLPLIQSGTPAKLDTKHVLDPRKLGLAAGDEVVYWAVAIDTKKPGNTPVESQRWRVKITSPAQPGPNELARNDQPQNNPNNTDPKNPPRNDNPNPNNSGKKPPSDPKNPEGNPPAQNPEGTGEKPPSGNNNPPSDPKSQNPDSQDPKNGTGEKRQPGAEEKSDPVNPEQDPSRAFEKLREHLEKNNEPETPPDAGKKPPEQPEKNTDKGNEDKGEKKNDGGEKKNDGKQPDDKKGKQGEEKKGSEKGAQEKKGDSGAGKQKQDGKQEAGKEPGKQPGSEPKQGGEGKQESGKKDAGKQSGSGSEKGNEKTDSKQSSAEKQGNTGKQGESGKQPGAGEKSTGQEKAKKPDGNDSGEKKQPGEVESGKSPDNKSGEATGKKDDKNSTDTEEGPAPGDPNTKGGETNKGEGETKQGVAKKDENGKKTPGEDDKGGGDREKPSGGSDKGQKQDGGPSPASQGKQDTKDKTGKPEQDSKTGNEKGDEAKSPAHGDKNTASKGGESGDKKGGGKPGGGQNAPQPGQGGAGKTTESQTGANAGKEAGEGETIDRAGDKGPAPGKTGKSGSDQPGEGSKSAPKKGEGSGKNPEKSGETGEAGKQGAESSTDSSETGEGGKAGSGKPNGTTDKGEAGPGHGKPVQGGSRKGDFDESGKSDPALNDPVNLNDAIQGVDLALKHLKDELEKPNPDQQLLDSVGGSREKAQQFYQRWKKMRDEALKGGAENSDARKRFEESLRGLGISGGTAKGDSTGTKTDDLRGRSTTVVPPPPSYRDRTSGFRTGISKPTPESK